MHTGHIVHFHNIISTNSLVDVRRVVHELHHLHNLLPREIHICLKTWPNADRTDKSFRVVCHGRICKTLCNSDAVNEQHLGHQLVGNHRPETGEVCKEEMWGKVW